MLPVSIPEPIAGLSSPARPGRSAYYYTLSLAGGGFLRAARLPEVAMTRLRAYVALTKPRIIELLLITTLPAMFLAARGLPPLWLVVATLIGGSLSAGGANKL